MKARQCRVTPRYCKHPRLAGYYVLLETLVVPVRGPSGSDWITIPAGFVWNLASLPRVTWPIMGRPDACQYFLAGLKHDYLYATRKATRALADAALREDCITDGLDRGRANVVYAAVRLFAGGHYGRRDSDPQLFVSAEELAALCAR